jgi:hypothetical protein
MGYKGLGQQQGFREVFPNHCHVMQYDQDGLTCFMPLMDQGEKVPRGFGVYSCKRLIQKDKICLLNHDAGKEDSLELSTAQLGEASVLKSLKFLSNAVFWGR